MNLKQVLLLMTAAAAAGAILAMVVRPGLLEVLIAWALISSIILVVLSAKGRGIKT